jgi:hypothetical protein
MAPNDVTHRSFLAVILLLREFLEFPFPRSLLSLDPSRFK